MNVSDNLRWKWKSEDFDEGGRLYHFGKAEKLEELVGGVDHELCE